MKIVFLDAATMGDASMDEIAALGEFVCYPSSTAEEARARAADADVVLLGPQIRFSKDKIAAQVPGVPVEAIDMRMYGRMDGQGVLALAQQLMEG